MPSKGKPYGDRIPHGLITVYSMTTQEEKLFAGISKKIDFENVIDALIKRCSGIPDSLRPGDLYVGDRVFLMMNIRAASYGAQYGFKVTCPECRARWDHDLDITKDLEVQEVSEDHQDPFEVELPMTHDLVALRLFRGDDERAIIQYVDRQNKRVNIRQIGDPGYTYRMSLHLMGVKSNSDPSTNFDIESCQEKPGAFQALATEYIESLTAQDSSVIREEIDNRTPGLVLAMEMNCPKCDADFPLSLPLSADFFRAKSTSGPRTSARVVPGAAR